MVPGEHSAFVSEAEVVGRMAGRRHRDNRLPVDLHRFAVLQRSIGHVVGVERNIGRVFQCSAELAGPVRKLFFHHLLAKPPQAPDFFLFVVTSRSAGLLSIESETWKSDGVVLFALSQAEELQEAMLLMPSHSWFRGGLGTFIADPDRARPWRGMQRLFG